MDNDEELPNLVTLKGSFNSDVDFEINSDSAVQALIEYDILEKRFKDSSNE